MSNPIIPRDAGGVPLMVVIAALTFLACIALAFALSAGRAADDWTAGLAGRWTVIVKPVPGTNTDERLQAAADALRTLPGIDAADPLGAAETRAIVAPWLGADADLELIAAPRLIDVRLAPGARPDEAEARARLEAAAPGAVLDDHARWAARLQETAGAVIAFAWGALGLIGLGTAAIIAFATQASLAAHRDVVEALHLIGARDTFIAAQVQARFFRLSLQAGALGLGAAVAALAVLGLAASGDAETVNFLPRFGLSTDHYPWLLTVPAVATMITTAAARFTALSAIARRV